jgi:hypothetical protein
VSTDKLADSSVTSPKIKDGTILKEDVKPSEIIGEQGPPGPVGPAGPTQTFSVQIVQKSAAATPNGNSQLIVSCPEGTTIVSGGWHVPANSGLLPITDNPIANAWVIEVKNPTTADSVFSAYALCATLSTQ